MSNIPRFAAYAAAFEKSYETDDWSIVEPFLAEHAVYDADDEFFMGGHFEGRASILAYFKAVLVLEEIVTFEGDHIIHLEDHDDDEMKKELLAYMNEHGETLALALDR